MAEIVNLRRARKAKARAAAEAGPAANRERFGRPKAERDRVAAERRLADSKLEGHRRNGEEPGRE